MTGSNRIFYRCLATAVLMSGAFAVLLLGEEPAIRVRLTASKATQTPMTVEVLRWSTDSERASIAAALKPPPAPPAGAAPAGAAPEGRGGRAGRGARGGGPPASPAARLTAAVKSAPTVGYIWGDGPTGFAIRYAWRSALPDGRERVVLVTDRRVGASSESGASPAATADAEFTLIEMRIDRSGAGEAKASHVIPVITDPASNALSLDGYDTVPDPLKVTR